MPCRRLTRRVPSERAARAPPPQAKSSTMPAFLAGPLLSPGVAAAVAAGAAAASALIIDMTKENRLSVEEITRLARAKASDAAAAAAAVSGLDAADVKTAKDYAMAILPIDQIQAMLDAIESQATASMGAGEKRSAKEQWDELRSLLNQVCPPKPTQTQTHPTPTSPEPNKSSRTQTQLTPPEHLRLQPPVPNPRTQPNSTPIHNSPPRPNP